ncbi:hypothetical protein AVEN_271344-1 [Araneus ventricosus]|uniref:Transposable element Tc3 transposase n=1 Tax=Araneus ventricosus TaxID=182803 RepID=A0A4Y2FGI3_ARAVE|nr:hypothetical protein AVEN_271344-1 [Araneus ventricosus]
MLQIFALPQIEELQPNIIFQQYGAPPHWSSEMRKVSDEKLPRRWIGRGGPIPWPPRSSDITPLDLFLWEYVENIIYQSPIRDTDELKSRITAAIQTVDSAMLHRTWLEISYRLDVLRATNGAHIEIVDEILQKKLCFFLY